MKGVIFTEFLEFVEERFGAERATHLVESLDRPSRGRYSPMGNYDHAELQQLIAQLSASQGVSAAELTRRFGIHLFHRFAALYPAFVAGAESVIEFMTGIEDYIHAELRKLYPDAEFPSLECRVTGSDRLQIVYRSRRGLADLAEGLILGCAAHFGEVVELKREDLQWGDPQAVRFSLVSRASRH